MIFITGPLFSGKKEYICKTLNWTDEDFKKKAAYNVHDRVDIFSDINEMAESLMSYEVVIASEIGSGIVPLDPEERYIREQCGRLSCILAAEAEVVIRVCCGLPQILKGKL